MKEKLKPIAYLHTPAMSDGDTTIRISRGTWRRLTDRKEPNTTYDDIVGNLLDEVEERQPAESPAD